MGLTAKDRSPKLPPDFAEGANTGRSESVAGSRQLVGVAAPNEGVKQTMRKLLALSLVACLAVSTAVLFQGCAQQEPEQATTEQPAEMPADTSGMMEADTTAHDSM